MGRDGHRIRFVHSEQADDPGSADGRVSGFDAALSGSTVTFTVDQTEGVADITETLVLDDLGRVHGLVSKTADLSVEVISRTWTNVAAVADGGFYWRSAIPTLAQGGGARFQLRRFGHADRATGDELLHAPADTGRPRQPGLPGPAERQTSVSSSRPAGIYSARRAGSNTTTPSATCLRGYTVTVQESVAQTTTHYRGETDAENVTVDASGFSGNLSGTDTDVQTALGTLDTLSVSGGGGGADLSDDTPQSVHTVGQAGSGDEASRDDHRHAGVGTLTGDDGIQVNQTTGNVTVTARLSSAAPEPVGATENAGGTDETISRSRHVHAGVTSITAGTGISVNSSQGAVTVTATGGGGGGSVATAFSSSDAYDKGALTYTGTGVNTVVWVADQAIGANSTEPTLAQPQNWLVVAGAGEIRGLISDINVNVMRIGDIFWLEQSGGPRRVFLVRTAGTHSSSATLIDSDNAIELTDGRGSLKIEAYSSTATYSRGSANSVVTHDNKVWVYVSTQRNTNHDPEQFPQYWWKIDTPIRVLNHDSATTAHWRSGDFFLTETGELRMATATISASPADIIADHTGADQEFLWLNEPGGGSGTTVTANPSGTDGDGPDAHHHRQHQLQHRGADFVGLRDRHPDRPGAEPGCNHRRPDHP